MKAVVSADGPGLDAGVAANFARCPFFAVVEVEDLSCESMPNPWATAGGGAGPEAAKLVASTGAQVAITGLVGPNAFRALQEAGIQVFVAPEGTVRSAVNAYRAAHLPPLLQPNAQPHSPFGGQTLVHGNLGMGRSGLGTRRQLQANANSGASDERLGSLRASVRAMEEGMETLRAQIKELEQRSQGREP